jgi:hypothetical protein
LAENRTRIFLDRQITERYDAHNFSVFKDWQAPNTFFSHDLNGVFVSLIRRERRYVLAADRFKVRIVDVLALRDRPDDDVPVGHDPTEIAVLLDDNIPMSLSRIRWAASRIGAVSVLGFRSALDDSGITASVYRVCTTEPFLVVHSSMKRLVNSSALLIDIEEGHYA